VLICVSLSKLTGLQFLAFFIRHATFLTFFLFSQSHTTQTDELLGHPHGARVQQVRRYDLCVRPQRRLRLLLRHRRYVTVCSLWLRCICCLFFRLVTLQSYVVIHMRVNILTYCTTPSSPAQARATRTRATRSAPPATAPRTCSPCTCPTCSGTSPTSSPAWVSSSPSSCRTK